MANQICETCLFRANGDCVVKDAQEIDVCYQPKFEAKPETLSKISKHYGFGNASGLEKQIARSILHHNESAWWFQHMADGVTIYEVIMIPDEGLKQVVVEILQAIKDADYKSPEEVAKMFNPDYLNFQKGVEATKELYKDYVKQNKDNLTPAKLLGETLLPSNQITSSPTKNQRLQDAYTRSKIAKVLKDLACPITISTVPEDTMGHEVYLIKKDAFDHLIAELEESCQTK